MDYQQLEAAHISAISQLEVDYQLILSQLERQSQGMKIMPDYALYKKAIEINERIHTFKYQLNKMHTQQQELNKPIKYNWLGLPIR